MADRDLPAGIPGWRRAPCLGCAGRVIANRDAHVAFSGPRDASVLIVTGAEPQHGFSTRLEMIFRPTMYLLGVAHRGCIEQARQRLEAGSVALPESLPIVEASPDPDEPERLDLPPAVDRCPYCGECEEMSDEDIFPKWVSRLFAERYGGFSVNTPYGRRDAATLNVKAPIGRACNNQWLSVLENDVKEIMRSMIVGPGPGGPSCRTLTPAHQQLLATWAVKTALMFDLYAGAGAVIPTYYYRQLRLYRRALPNMVVLLGAYRGHERAVFAAHGGLRLSDDPTLPPNAFMTVITVFCVVFKVIGYLGPTFPQSVTYDSGFWDGVHRIWPAQGHDIEWPRNSMAFHDEALMEFAHEQPRMVGGGTRAVM